MRICANSSGAQFENGTRIGELIVRLQCRPLAGNKIMLQF